jgi:hypothetical protein
VGDAVLLCARVASVRYAFGVARVPLSPLLLIIVLKYSYCATLFATLFHTLPHDKSLRLITHVKLLCESSAQLPPLFFPDCRAGHSISLLSLYQYNICSFQISTCIPNVILSGSVQPSRMAQISAALSLAMFISRSEPVKSSHCISTTSQSSRSTPSSSSSKQPRS